MKANAAAAYTLGLLEAEQRDEEEHKALEEREGRRVADQQDIRRNYRAEVRQQAREAVALLQGLTGFAGADSAALVSAIGAWRLVAKLAQNDRDRLRLAVALAGELTKAATTPIQAARKSKKGRSYVQSR